MISFTFVNMLVIKDRHSLSILKSLGFTSADLKKLYMIGLVLLVILSIVLGMILTNTLGKSLAGIFIENMGIANFRFFIDEVFVFLVTPLSMVASVLIGTHLASQSIKKMKVSGSIRG